MPDFDLGAMGALTTGAAYLTGLIVSGLTLIRPGRASWVAFAAALAVGILAAFLLAFATLDPATPFTRQTYAQIVVVGIFAAGGAAGASVTQASAEAKRERVLGGGQSEPDPHTPQSRGDG